jgi:hypothetical protein
LFVAVLSIDLAYGRWADLGVVVIEQRHAARDGINDGGREDLARFPLGTPWPSPSQASDHSEATADGAKPDTSTIHCEIVPTLGAEQEGERGPVDANVLAGLLNHMATVRGIQVMMLDGPQAWKSGDNGCEHARVSEHQLNTAAKTGLPGMVKPLTYRPFAEFCLDVYESLCRRGWRRLATREQPGQGPERVLVESYPHAAWKALGLKPLPSKRRARVSDLAEAYGALQQVIPFTTNRPPNHDQLQAIVGGLAGLAIEARDAAGTQIVGNPPRREGGHWREGFIVLPTRPVTPPAWLESFRWLD